MHAVVPTCVVRLKRMRPALEADAWAWGAHVHAHACAHTYPRAGARTQCVLLVETNSECILSGKRCYAAWLAGLP